MSTTGTDWAQIKSSNRHGTQNYGQASDGTGTSGNLPEFNADGSLTDSGVPATSAATTWIEEIPTGALDSSNKTFTLLHSPVGSGPLKSLHCLRNGVYQDANWISLSGSTITFAVALSSADQLFASYQY